MEQTHTTEIPDIDWEQIELYCEGEPPRQNEIYAEFIDEVPVTVEALKSLLIAGNAKEAFFASHDLKGSAAMLGFAGMAAHLNEVEKRVKEGSCEGCDAFMAKAVGSYERGLQALE